MIDDFKHELDTGEYSVILTKWFYERIPVIFRKKNSFLKWKHEIADRLEIDPREIIVTGSASTGFSVSPFKPFKKYDQNSDIDLAVISNFYFDLSWKWMRELGAGQALLPKKAFDSLQDHKKRLVFYGTIATDKLLPHLPFGKRWQRHLLEISAKPPANGKQVNVRIYRDFSALRAYHADGLRKLSEALLNQ